MARRRTLGRMFGLSEDRVATRALTDIIQKAIDAGSLSDSEKTWATQLQKAIEKSGPDQLTYPTLSLTPHGSNLDQSPRSAPPKKDKVTKAAKGDAPKAPAPSGKRGIDVDPLAEPGQSVPDPALSQAQSVWDRFSSMPGRGPEPAPDMGLGRWDSTKKPAATMPGDEGDGEEVPNLRPMGALSRIFGGRSKKRAAKDTWDRLGHGSPRRST
jgi:hypothetical protein